METSNVGPQEAVGRTFNPQHSLDSDEEDQEVPRRMLEEETLRAIGQEEETIRSEGGVQIMPFNLREEMQDGYFDEAGFYVPKGLEDEDLKDGWLDTLEYSNVEQTQRLVERQRQKEWALKVKKDEEPGIAEESLEVLTDESLWNTILGFLHPGESVARAIRRCGNKPLGGSQQPRWKKKKAVEKEVSPSQSEKEEQEKSQGDWEKLNVCVNCLVERGEYDVYQETYESLKVKLTQSQREEASKRSHEDDELIPEEGSSAAKSSRLASEPLVPVTTDSAAGTLSPESTSAPINHKTAVDEVDIFG